MGKHQMTKAEWAVILNAFKRLKSTRDVWQTIVVEWVKSRFSYDPTHDPMAIPERARRFIEESLELVQAAGMTEDEAIKVLRIVYARPPGEVSKEIGQVMNTLNAFAGAAGLSLHDEEVREIERVMAKPIEDFQKRHLEKRELGI